MRCCACGSFRHNLICTFLYMLTYAGIYTFGHERLSAGSREMATTVRVDDQLHVKLREIASEERRPIGQVIEAAIAHYQKERFWQEVEASVERLRADPVAWQEYRKEIALFEGGSMDGLE